MMPRVFISYSHDSEPHREAVLRLAQELRAWGVDVLLDRFVVAPAEGWPRWMMSQVESADFVIVVCTATYRRRFEGQEAAGKGKGATFEGLLAIQHLYDEGSRNARFIPVIFEGTPEGDIPSVLRPYQRYTLPRDLEPLFRHITGQPEIVAAPLGPLKVLQPRGAGAASGPAAAPSLTPAPGARSAVPPAPVLSAGGGDVRIEPPELLHRLLVSLFTQGDAFRQWVSLGPEGDTLVAEFPGGSASTSAMVASGLDVLRRHGYLDADFFARLGATFPRRRADIERVALVWGAPLAPTTTTTTTTQSGFHFANAGNVTIHAGGDVVARDKVVIGASKGASGTEPHLALEGLRTALVALGGAAQPKIARALADLAEELEGDAPDPDEVRAHLDRALTFAARVDPDIASRPSVAPHVAVLRAWASARA